MSPDTVILKSSAPAKINLALKLVGKRADGYHLLDSVFVPFPALVDHLTVTLTEGDLSVKMSSNLPEMTDSETNLCSKAAKLYLKMTEISVNCHIHLQKNIPIGAGLGGGSSDCAAILKMLNSFYNKLSEKELSELALQLGADVPFFISCHAARVRGIGEKIEKINGSFNAAMLVVYPPFESNTAWAYKNLDPSVIGSDPSQMTDFLSSAIENDDILTASKYLANDFESLLFKKFPAYDIWRRELLGYGALHVGLSGSGSAFFAIFKDVENLNSAAEFLRKKYNGSLRIFAN